MQDWGGGYPTDIEYDPGFYQAQAPIRMALAAAVNGIETPDLSGDFSYCELGCGRGGTILVLAALHPNAEFHAVDFNPAHIARAQAQARAAGLANLHFHELDFRQLLDPAHAPLPMFDFVAMHGVWTWIAPDLQQAIIDFTRDRLRSGGLLYVSYNAMPGWTTVLPAQRILWELARQSEARSDAAARGAIDMLARMTLSGGFQERVKDGAERIQGAANSNRPFSYLVHEYINAHWRPLYHLDVARALAGAKLSFAASGDLLRNFQNMVLTSEQAALIAQIDAPDLRETLKDFFADTWFRADIYVRGVRRMTEQRRESVLGAVTLALLRRPPETFHINRADGSAWRPDPRVYRPVLEALAARPHRISELLSLADLPADHKVSAVELIGVLVGTDVAAPFDEPGPGVVASATRFNELVERSARDENPDASIIAVATLGVGMTLSAIGQELYSGLRQGLAPDPPTLARGFIARCRARGVVPTFEGKPIEDEAAALERLTDEFAKLSRELVPIWAALGVA